MQKIITTHLSRRFTVIKDNVTPAIVVEVENTLNGAEIASRILKDDAVDLGKAVLEASGQRVFTYEGSLPGVGIDGTYYVAGDEGKGYQSRSVHEKSEHVMGQIKSLIAIHSKLVKREEEAKTEAAEKRVAEEALRNRRDTLVNLFADSVMRSYAGSSDILKNAVDHVIELEDKMAAAKSNA